jgi:hypothetical protein
MILGKTRFPSYDNYGSIWVCLYKEMPMILYYTATQKTKIFAQALQGILNMPIYQLESKLGKKVSFGFIAQSLFLTLANKPYPVDNMPQKIDTGEIYLCAPIWGGHPAAPAKYFLRQADLKGKKTHLLLTCENITGSEKYKKNALDFLDTVDCSPGFVYVFATGKNKPEMETVTEQLRDMLPG